MIVPPAILGAASAGCTAAGSGADEL